MAASSGDQSLRDALECPVCKDFFTEPKQLECGHTYCLSCVNGLEKVPNVVHRIVGEDFFDGVGPLSTLVQSVQNNVQCPQCRKMCLVPDTGLSTNYAIKDMVDKFRESAKMVDDGVPLLRLGSCTTQPMKKEQQKHCHACAKKVPESELFICKDCNKPTKKQFICALCVVRSHKQHTVVTLDCLAIARDRELAALRIEEIMVHAQRIGDEARGMQHDITKQFETMREKLVAKLNSFYQLQNECLDNEQNPLKEQVEGKVYEAIYKCEQLNEHFLRLRELKMEFENHLKRWQDELIVDDVMAPPLLSFPPFGTSPSPTHFCGLVIPEAEQTTPTSSSRRCARPSHFVFSNNGGVGGDDRRLAELLAGASGSATSKKAPPILVAQRRRSRLRGGAGGVGFTGGSGGGPSGGSGSSSSSMSASVSVLPSRNTDGGGGIFMPGGAEHQQHPMERDLFSFVDQ